MPVYVGKSGFADEPVTTALNYLQGGRRLEFLENR